MTYRLGVDVGTTFTAAAVANGAAPSMLGLGNRALQVPSVLFLVAEGDFLVGEAAERRGMSEPGRLVREFKRRIGDPAPLLVAGMPFSPEILTAELLRWVVHTAADRMGEQPTETIVTHPANWGPYKLEQLEQIVSLADIGPSRRCAEPVAAAAQYAARTRVDSGDRLAVYDLGGGTFDACVLEQTLQGFRLLGTPEGIDHLGGVDFDEALLQHVVTGLGNQVADLDLGDPAVTVGLARMRRDVVEAKEALSGDVAATIPVALPGVNTTIRVTRTELETLIRPALRATMDALGRAVRSGGLSAPQLRAIVLVGGSSRIPLVREMLEREFGVPVAIDTHPKHDVALGATLIRPDAALAAEPLTNSFQTIALAPIAERTADPEQPTRVEQPPAVPTPAGPPPAGHAAWTPSDAGRPKKRPRLVVVSLAAAVAAGVIAGAVIANPRFGWLSEAQVGTQPSTTAGTAAPASSGPSTRTSSSARPTPSASAKVDPTLPRSAALTQTQMLLPMSFDGGGHFHVYLADAADGTVGEPLTRGDDSDFGALISPDRQSVIFTRKLSQPRTAQEREIKVMAADGGHLRDLFSAMPEECSRIIYRPAWNPVDQTVLAAPCLSTNGVTTLILIHTNGKLMRTIDIGSPPGVPWRIGDPSFSPDGKRLVFWAGPGKDGGALYISDLEKDQRPQRLTSANFPGRDADPTWTRDGKTITFRRRVADGTSTGNLDIFQIPADGSGTPEPVIQSRADDLAPSWSPDGDHLAYESDARTPTFPGAPVLRIWLADSQGKHRHVLLNGGGTAIQAAPSWTTR
jgi:molecular chaperone DnaK